ncbi:MAG TPA: FtsX-like permease family protein [Nitrospiraceae bacterium]|nr:FtsX-like permease family protein [Nitrospiraceae bacterium]
MFEAIRRHASERPARTLLTIAGIALGVAVAVAIRAANVHVLDSFQRSVTSVAGRATIQVSAGDLRLDERLVDSLRQHPDVRSATPILHIVGRVATGPHAGGALTIIAMDLFDAADVKNIRFEDGSGDDPPLKTFLSPDAVFLGARLAEEWNVHPGDALDITVGGSAFQVTVRGILDTRARQSSIWDRLAVMDIAAAQVAFGALGRVDRYDVVTDPSRQVDDMIRELKIGLPAGVTVERPSSRNEQVEHMIRAFQLNLSVLSTVSLLIGLFLVYNTVSFAVVQRRREIGILSVMGLSRRGVSLLFLAESACMGLLGGLLGTVCGVLLAEHLVGRLARTISDLYVSVETADVSVARFLLDLPPSLWAGGALLGVGVSVFGALVPSLDASGTAPAKALGPGDYEASKRVRTAFLAWLGGVFLMASGLLSLMGPFHGVPVFGYTAALCLLLGLSCLIPLVVRLFGTILLTSERVSGRKSASLSLLPRLAADQISRTPGRSAVTISAMMIGVAIMVGIGTMIGSFRHTVELWIEQTVIADLIVAPGTWLQGHESGPSTPRLSMETARQLAAISGVAAVDTYRDRAFDYRGRRVSLVSRDLRVHGEHSRYLLTAGDAAPVLKQAAAEEGVLVSEVFARTMGVARGDALLLITPSGERGFQILGVFYDYATDGGKIVMERRLYQRLWGDETVTVIPIYLAAHVSPSAVRSQIEARLNGNEAEKSSDPRQPVVVISNGELRAEIMAIFDRTFTVTYALELIAIVIAVLGIVNTLVTSVLQRRQEFALLRSLGTHEGHVRGLMLWESAYLSVLGGMLGILGGILLSVLLIEVINKQSFGWTIHFVLQPWVLLQSVALASAAALIAGYFPARWAARQSIAEGLRYE